MTSGHRNPWLVLVVVCMAQFMVILDATIVNVALPSIQADLGMSDSDLQWVVNAYALTFGGFLLLGVLPVVWVWRLGVLVRVRLRLVKLLLVVLSVLARHSRVLT